MAHEVRIENERGEVIRSLGVVTALDRRWTSEDEGRFPWLTAIDPYGVTTLNYRQLKHVLHELSALRTQIDDLNDQRQIDDLMRWVEEVPDRHLYLKLLGD